MIIGTGGLFLPKAKELPRGSSHDHVQGLRWSQQDPGERVVQDSLIGHDSSPVGCIKLGAVR